MWFEETISHHDVAGSRVVKRSNVLSQTTIREKRPLPVATGLGKGFNFAAHKCVFPLSAVLQREHAALADALVDLLTYVGGVRRVRPRSRSSFIRREDSQPRKHSGSNHGRSARNVCGGDGRVRARAIIGCSEDGKNACLAKFPKVAPHRVLRQSEVESQFHGVLGVLALGEVKHTQHLTKTVVHDVENNTPPAQSVPECKDILCHTYGIVQSKDKRPLPSSLMIRAAKGA